MPALPNNPAALESYIADLIKAKWLSLPDAGHVHFEEFYIDDANDFTRKATVKRQYDNGAEETRVNYILIKFQGFPDVVAADCNGQRTVTLNYSIEVVYEAEAQPRPDGRKSVQAFKALLMYAEQAFNLDRTFGHTSDQIFHEFLKTAEAPEIAIVDGVESHTATLAISIPVTL